MAIQAQMYPENLSLPLVNGSLDWLFTSNNNFNNLRNTNNNFNKNKNQNNFDFNEFPPSKNLQLQQQQQQDQEVVAKIQQRYLQHLQNQQHKSNNNNNINININNCTSPTTTSTTTTTGSKYEKPVYFTTTAEFYFEMEQKELKRSIKLQKEKLQLAYQRQRDFHLSTVMRKLEFKSKMSLAQKDKEIAKSTKRRDELQDIITKLEIENQDWQRLAIENEAMVASLNDTLEQIKQQAFCATKKTSSLCCSSNEVDKNNFGGVFNKKEYEEKRVLLCKVCKNEKASILLLPCKHLCCCKGCEKFVDACPICEVAKMASIEALIS